jgi:hypothetical protein
MKDLLTVSLTVLSRIVLRGPEKSQAQGTKNPLGVYYSSLTNQKVIKITIVLKMIT